MLSCIPSGVVIFYILSLANLEFLEDCTLNLANHSFKNLAPCGTDGRLLLSGFQLLVTLTLTLDRVIQHTVVHH